MHKIVRFLCNMLCRVSLIVVLDFILQGYDKLLSYENRKVKNAISIISFVFC